MSNPSKQLYEFPQRENNQSLRDRLTSKEWQFYIERFPELAAGDTHVIKVNADIVSAHTQEIFLSLPDRKVLTFGLDRFLKSQEADLTGMDPCGRIVPPA